MLTNSLLSTTPSQTISTSFQAQEKQAPIPPPGRRWGQNRGGRQHPTKHYRDKEPPSLEAVLIKITHNLSRIQRSRVLMCCWGSQFASCTLGGLHGASHSWDQQVT